VKINHNNNISRRISNPDTDPNPDPNRNPTVITDPQTDPMNPQIVTVQIRPAPHFVLCPFSMPS